MTDIKSLIEDLNDASYQAHDIAGLKNNLRVAARKLGRHLTDIHQLRGALADYDRELDTFASMTFSADSEVSAQEMAKQDLDMLRKRHGHLLSEKANEVKP